MRLTLKEQVLAPSLLAENLAKIEANNLEISRLRKENNTINAYNTKLKKVINNNQEFFDDNSFILDGESVLVHEMFGKKYRDLTPKQRKKYDKVRNHTYYMEHNASKHKKYDSNTWCIEHFGKRHRNLNPDELREFNRLQARAYRKRKLEDK